MASFSIDGSPRGALDAYLADSFERFLHTYGLARDVKGRGLELGSNPYFTTFLLSRYTDLELELANYFGVASGGTSHNQVLSWTEDCERRELLLASRHFNLEEERFPYDDGSFELVLFCEIIEHLLMDPTHALREINRTLTAGGSIILTTPNVARLDNVLRLIRGAGIGDPYSGNGAYGRHNREYTLHELSRLLAFTGFEIDHAFTADSYMSDHRAEYAYSDVVPLLQFRGNDLGHYLFVRARKVGEPSEGLPSFLFSGYPAERMREHPL
jgi:SAM-dependent methyltransferase